MTGTVAYILAKKIALGAVSGIKGLTFNDNQIIFNFNDGSQATMTVPLPKDGEPGADGKDGVSLADMKFNEDGHLICTLSDGTEIDAGELKCDCQGQGLIQAETKDAFPQSGESNVLYLALDTNTLYYWDGEYKVVTSSSSDNSNLGLATKEDIDSLFGDNENFDNLGLATEEDIDSLFK